MTVLTAHNATLASGIAARRAADGVALTFRGGHISLLQGPPGGGKTILLSILGVEPYPCSEAHPVAGPRRFIGFMPQSFRLFPLLTVVENVRIPLDLRGDEFDAADARARHLLTLVGLAHRLMAAPDELNSGERRRVAIARALALDPLVLLADQPTASLDSACCRDVARVLRRTASDLGKAVVIVSDDDRLKPFADRCFQVDGGCVQSNDVVEAW